MTSYIRSMSLESSTAKIFFGCTEVSFLWAYNAQGKDKCPARNLQG